MTDTKSKSIIVIDTNTMTAVFVVLKLNDVVDWSWLWVLSPLWITWVLGILLSMLASLAE